MLQQPVGVGLVEVGVGGDLSRRARRERLSFVMLRTSILTLHEKQ